MNTEIKKLERDLQSEFDTLAFCVFDLCRHTRHPLSLGLQKIIQRIQDKLDSEVPRICDGGPIAGIVVVYTDGSCDPNPGPGGWAATILGLSDVPRIVQGSSDQTTNNRMELAAAIGSLHYIIEACHKDGIVRKVIIHTDSKYVMDGITEWIKAWKRQGWVRPGRNGKPGEPVKNRDLWEKLDTVVNDHRVEITWKWVRGHNDDEYNNMADEHAFRARVERIEYLVDGKPLG